MTIENPPARENRRNVAVKIVELSDQRLSTSENTDHISPKIGLSVAVVVSNSDQVGFFIRSTELLDKIKQAGLSLKKGRVKNPKDENKYVFRALSPENIEAHKELFREIVEESIQTTIGRRLKRD